MPPLWDGNAHAPAFEDPLPPPPPQQVPHSDLAKPFALGAVTLALLVAGWFLVSLFQPFAGSGEGEGIVAVTDWFKLDPQGIEVQIDEDGESGVRARLTRRGFGPKEAAHVVAGARARG